MGRPSGERPQARVGLALFCLCLVVAPAVVRGFSQSDYQEAMSKTIRFWEAQRSGPLAPGSDRVPWRGSSALDDGSLAGVDLSGGYYDAGDNVKFGFPMAFTVTMMSWSVVEYGDAMSSSGELQHALDAIRWGTDWFLKAFHGPTTLYAQVGDGNSDHACWSRPEDMTTPRTVYKIDQNNPGSDLAGETAAALAAASMALSASDPSYASTLLDNAKQLFQFADQYRGVYSDSIPQVQNFYNSFSGYKDELLWAAAWLHRASGDGTYLSYVDTNAQALNGLGSITELSWDNKLAAAQILLSRQVLHCGASSQNLQQMKQMAEQYVCAYVNGGVQTTPDGLAWIRQWAPLQYSNNAAFVTAVYSDYLAEAGQSLTCGGKTFTPDQIIAWSQSQVDYVLGKNNAGQSFMVGFSSKYPQKMHHRGASIPVTQTPYSCGEGFQFLTTSNADSNLITGAISGGPAQDGSYADDRNHYEQSEPITYINAGFLGAVARLVRGTSGVNAACTAAGGGGSNPAPATTPSPPAHTPASTTSAPAQTPAHTTGAPAHTPSTPSQTQSPTSAPSHTPSTPSQTSSPPSDTPSTPSQTPSPPSDTPSTPSQTPSPPSDTPSTPSQNPSPPADTPSTPSQTSSPPADTPSTPSQTPSPPADTPSAPSQTPSSPSQAPSPPANTPSTPEDTPASTPSTPSSTPGSPASTPSTPASTPSTPASTPGSPASTPSTPTSTPSAPTSAPTTSTGSSFTITTNNDAAWTNDGQKVSLYTVVVKNTSGQTFDNVAIACNNFHPDQYWNIMKGGTDGDCSVPTWMSSFAPEATLTFGYIQTGSGAQFSINL